MLELVELHFSFCECSWCKQDGLNVLPRFLVSIERSQWLGTGRPGSIERYLNYGTKGTNGKQQ